jgi:hypothetical protein
MASHTTCYITFNEMTITPHGVVLAISIDSASLCVCVRVSCCQCGDTVLVARIRAIALDVSEELGGYCASSANGPSKPRSGRLCMLISSSGGYLGLLWMLCEFVRQLVLITIVVIVAQEHCTALHRAALWDRTELAHLLLSAGANPCIRDSTVWIMIAFLCCCALSLSQRQPPHSVRALPHSLVNFVVVVAGSIGLGYCLRGWQ